MKRSIFITTVLAALGVIAFGVVAVSDSQEGYTMATRYVGQTTAPDFPAGVEWLNTSCSFSMRDFRGKIVMLDFWTYCCINCIHVIPDLKRLEEKYARELVVIGVHSAKFTTERETQNIRQAILRYEIEHPVVNDHRFEVWRAYGARAWPTIALIDPNGKIVGMHSGEGAYDTFDPIISEMVGYFEAQGALDRTPLDLQLEAARAPSSLLSFPGKIVADQASDRLYISDSNHNRVVVSTLSDARVVKVVGSGEIGLDDGPAEAATFNKPQGMALFDGRLYVADTENHAIREVDLTTWTVTTIAGTGRQARAFNRSGVGRSVALNSPWDLYAVGRKLYVAMAGSHQIWVFDVDSRRAEPYAGSSREDRTDGSLQSAALAQPSGLASDGERLYVADSEVSAVRVVDLDPNGRVRTLAGGELFEFGLKDADGTDARFQHPLGVAWCDGKVYVADTYNNAIRAIDTATGRVSTFFGDGHAGSRDGDSPRLDEPNDVEVIADELYVADTNNHRIRIAPLNGGPVRTLVFSNPEALRPKAVAHDLAPPSKVVKLAERSVAPGASEITVEVQFPAGFHLNANAPSSYTVSELNGAGLFAGSPVTMRVSDAPIRIPVTFGEGMGTVAVDLTLYYCEDRANSLCYFSDVRLEIPVTVRKGVRTTGITAEYAVEVRM